jgi:hypothetical protein
MAFMRPVLLLLSVLPLVAGQAEQTFVGTISDDMCALDHTAMRMGPTDAECTHACVEEHDAAYVLVDGSAVFRLSDQRAAKPFAGKKVKVAGKLDKATNTITVGSISAA